VQEAGVKQVAKGETILTLDEAGQKRIGLTTELLAPAQISPEIKAYGRALEVAPLGTLVADVTAAQAAHQASQAELQRLKTLAAQNNASERALQTAEATAARDEAQFESARLKLVTAWGSAIAGRADLPAFVRSLASLESVVVRIDLPAGESLKAPPAHARLAAVSEEANSIEAELLGSAPAVDPQTQGQAFLFLVQPNPARLAPGAAVTGYLPVTGEPVNGVVISRSAVIRHEGAAWIYVESAGTNFVRREVSLDRPLANGWFVSSGVKPGERVVVVGAQSLFSNELTRSGFLSGERD
jgi:multidrug efflux pump subunit AcrA (membrane-fusion protein)